MQFALFKETLARLLRQAEPPTLTRRAVYLVGRSTCYSIAKARAQLGWQPRTGIQEGVRRTLAWFCGLEEYRHIPVRLAPLADLPNGVGAKH
jgi:nucleoside-diphosphate-sugar epimerase